MSRGNSERIPVTIIGGYLGAGKTTLLNHLLALGAGERMAVLVNDFGELSIDAALITSRDTNTIALANGCVCCSIADDLGAALDAQVRSSEPPLRIVVEASGVADPASIVRYALGWPGVRLDAVITMVDLETVREQATDRFVGALIVDQIQAADLIVANKVDRVDESSRIALGEWLACQATQAGCIETQFGRVAPAVVLGVERGVTKPISDGRADHTTAPFVSATCRTRRPFERVSLASALDRLPRSVVRYKGLVYLRDAPGRLQLLQGVGRRWTLEPAPGGELPLVAAGESVVNIIGVGPAEPIQSAAQAISRLA